METKRLAVLVELSRSRSMREVADVLGLTTSGVSQQIAVLAKEFGAPLVEPVGRGIRLTPAGRRLAAHAVDVLAAVDAAALDLDPGSDPVGTVRVAGFATAIRRSLLPVVDELERTRSSVTLVLHEYEPAEAFELLAADEVDLVLAYDYSLSPLELRPDLRSTRLWSAAWGMGVPTGADVPDDGDTVAVLRAVRDRPWIGNSRNTADERVLRVLAGLSDVAPRFMHTIDSLLLVEDLIRAGLGVGLLPLDQSGRAGVRVVPLHTPPVLLRAYAVTRQGTVAWPPLTLVLRLLGQRTTRDT